MSEKAYQVQGPFRVETSSDITLRSTGRGITLDATGNTGKQGHVQVQADSTVALNCLPAFVSLQAASADEGNIVVNAGPAGSILQMAGETESGAKIILGKDSIHLTVGSAADGASISLSAKGILLKFGTTSLCLTSSGIEESVKLISTRKLTATGHELKSAESQIKIDPVGVTVDAVMLKEQAQGIAQFQAPILKKAIDGMEKSQAGVMMVN